VRDASYKLNVVAEARSASVANNYCGASLWSEIIGGCNTPDRMAMVEIAA